MSLAALRFLSMEEFDDNGCETLDEAARGDIPPSSRLWSEAE